MRAVNPRSQSRRKLAPRGINIPLPGGIGRMLRAKPYKLEMKPVGRASCSLFLYFVVLPGKLLVEFATRKTARSGQDVSGQLVDSYVCVSSTLFALTTSCLPATHLPRYNSGLGPCYRPTLDYLIIGVQHCEPCTRLTMQSGIVLTRASRHDGKLGLRGGWFRV